MPKPTGNVTVDQLWDRIAATDAENRILGEQLDALRAENGRTMLALAHTEGKLYELEQAAGEDFAGVLHWAKEVVYQTTHGTVPEFHEAIQNLGALLGD